MILYAEYICAIRQYNLRDTPIQVSSAWQLIKNQFTGLRVMPVTHRNQSICMQMYSRYSEWTLAPFVFWNILVPANARSCANQFAEINQFISLRSDFSLTNTCKMFKYVFIIHRFCTTIIWILLYLRLQYLLQYLFNVIILVGIQNTI